MFRYYLALAVRGLSRNAALTALIIAAIGAVVGYAGNLWLAANQGIGRLGFSYLCIAAAAVLGLSQLAVLWPALRAALSPAAAMRGQ